MARTHLFVDTNVFLNFYSYAKDDLGQLTKLIDNLDTDKIVLHLPEQVLNELERNRETKLKASADQFKKESFPTAIPRHMQDYPQAQTYKEAVEAAQKARTIMINQAAADASNKSLAADKVLEALVDKSGFYPEDSTIFGRAMLRMHKGNPPGKAGSVGDQYNWEFLLENVPDEDLHIVSKDGDYSSELNTGRPHPFLEKEWREKKNANLHLYSELRPFLDKYLKAVKEEEELAEVMAAAQELEAVLKAAPLVVNEAEAGREQVEPIALAQPAAEQNPEKEEAINALVESGSFATTHSAIAKLEELRATLNTADVERLLIAALDNSQIGWIASDSDVYAFFTGLLNEHHDLDIDLCHQVAEVFGLLPDDEDRDPD
ncbi:PIN domain-containing protein [Chromobacterium haemolyticum]|uniref:PIN domain-containing protein n=1 Tax=Chromobacterium haemolyticum TaxID=394935 RepID=UPI001746A6B5|nr:PIN domain-containing protein [Chromobacterium haemolyticum]QOD81853.1 DUF4935 domain-containing protein [Chromobacterium haemolyticum]